MVHVEYGGMKIFVNNCDVEVIGLSREKRIGNEPYRLNVQLRRGGEQPRPDYPYNIWHPVKKKGFILRFNQGYTCPNSETIEYVGISENFEPEDFA